MRDVVASVPANVLAARLRSVLRTDVSSIVAASTVPVTYLRGTDDRLVSEASVRAVCEAARGRVSVARIPGPHLLLQVCPDSAWRSIDACEVNHP